MLVFPSLPAIMPDVEWYVIFDACDKLAIEATKTVPLSYKLDFHRTDHAELAAELMYTNWSNIFCDNECIDSAWEKFSLYTMKLIVRFIPKKT